VTTTVARYQRIAPFYDILDFPFERRRYQALRPLLFQSLSGHLLDAGIGTGRNCAFYPPDATVSGIDTSPAMLAIARRRCPILAAAARLYTMDVTNLEFAAETFDAAVATFLFLRAARPVTGARASGTRPRRQTGWADPVAGICSPARRPATAVIEDVGAVGLLGIWCKLRTRDRKTYTRVRARVGREPIRR
jgi:SAM-dependent methyltransferase